MFKYKCLKEEEEDQEEPTMDRDESRDESGTSQVPPMANGKRGSYKGSGSRKNSKELEERAVFHSQFSEEEFQRDLSARPKVTGPGGIFLPRLSELPQLVDEAGRVTVMCFTWNIAAKASRGLHRLNAVFAKIPAKERPDLIAVALQELPTSTIKFHNNVVEVVGEALSTTHRVYCWVRKWSQMFIIFIRKRLSVYTSHPEYKFIATSRVAKPFKTKGAIGICFRILQTSCVFIACHLTHGQLRNRVLDYQKLSRSFDFECLRRLPPSILSPAFQNHTSSPPNRIARSPSPHRRTFSQNSNNSRSAPNPQIEPESSSQTMENLVNSSNNLLPALLSPTGSTIHLPNFKRQPEQLPMKRAANVFWFGDLNFRVLPAQKLIGIGRQLENKLFRRNLDYQLIVENDELNLERSKGLLFEDFKEGVIKFPPTHKFVIGTNNYDENRVPSYTDRVLYWSTSPSSLTPLRYDCVWEITTSDHKPVYCLFGMKAVERARPLLPPSAFTVADVLVDFSQSSSQHALPVGNGHLPAINKAKT